MFGPSLLGLSLSPVGSIGPLLASWAGLHSHVAFEFFLYATKLYSTRCFYFSQRPYLEGFSDLVSKST